MQWEACPLFIGTAGLLHGKRRKLKRKRVAD